MDDICYRIAESRQDREQIFALRYRIYIEEMKRKQKYADDANRRIEEPYDRSAILFGLFDGEDCVGTVRANWLTDPTMQEYVRLYDAELPIADQQIAIITTKFMLARRTRRAISMNEFFRFIASEMLQRGVRYNFGDANDGVLKFFDRLGYQRWKNRRVVHDEYGEVTVLFLDLHDPAYLHSVRSPMADICESYVGLNGVSGSLPLSARIA